MSTDKYILDEDGKPKAEPNLLKWGKWFKKGDARRVAWDEKSGVKISTVFLGLDHNYGDGPPILWETMVFGGPMDQHQERCGGRREDALAMHERIEAEAFE